MISCICVFSLILITLLIHHTQADFYVLKPASFQPLIEKLGLNYTWAVNEVPFFDINDPDLVEAYYFRWKSYSDHIVMTPDGYVSMVLHSLLYSLPSLDTPHPAPQLHSQHHHSP
jgi:hypothetical protein